MLSDEEELTLNLIIEQSKNIGLDFHTNTLKIIEKFKNSLHENTIYTKLDMEDIESFKSELIDVEKAILNKQFVEFMYKKKHRKVIPLQLASFDGLWYLVGKDLTDKKTKTFTFIEIDSLEVIDEKYTDIPKDLQNKLNNAINAYFSADKKQYPVKLFIESNIAGIIKRKKISNSQRIIHEYNDGSLDVELYISNSMEIIPNIKVIEPLSLNEEINRNIKVYMNEQIF